jgi:hypothetical protein
MRVWGWAQVVRMVIGLGFMWLASGGRVFKPGWQGGMRGGYLRLWMFVTRWAAFWALVALFIWWLAPTWFVGSRVGLQTALQVLPAVIVAVFVLILGSVAVVAQMASSTWGTRAPVLLTIDDHFQQAVIRPVLLLVAVLLLAGQVPDEPADPSSLVTSLVAALALATLVLMYHATTIPVWVIQTVAPRSFPLLVVQDVDRELDDGKTGLVVLRGGLLSEMLKLSIKREDSTSVQGTLGAMLDLQEVYLRALPEQPNIAEHRPEDGPSRPHWLSDELRSGLVGAAEQAMRDWAPANDVNQIVRVLGAVARNFIEAAQLEDAKRCINGIIGLGTSAHQVTPTGVVNWHGPPAELLADLEAAAEEQGADELAAWTLAGWALAVAYPTYHFGHQTHPLWDSCIARLGDAPPWDEAEHVLRSLEWIRIWGNPQYLGPEPVVSELRRAERDHAHR